MVNKAAIIKLLVVVALGLFGILAWLLVQKEEPLRMSGNELSLTREYWQEYIREFGATRAQQDFLMHAKTATTTLIDTHTLAHLFGEALYEEMDLEGIGYCTSDFEFGCFHSFFGMAVKEKGIEILPTLDDACVAAFGGANLPCQHGLGHGILVYTGYDYDALLKALTLCESVRWQPIGGCSSGVFMEYNFHTMAASETGTTYLRPLSEDIYAPCSTLPEKHQPSCYHEQVQWWQAQYANDFTYIGTLCNAIEHSESKTTCFNGIGNYTAATYNLATTVVFEICGSMPSDLGRVECQQGAAWLTRGDGSGMQAAEVICEGLPEEGEVASCKERLY